MSFDAASLVHQRWRSRGDVKRTRPFACRHWWIWFGILDLDSCFSTDLLKSKGKKNSYFSLRGIDYECFWHRVAEFTWIWTRDPFLDHLKLGSAWAWGPNDFHTHTPLRACTNLSSGSIRFVDSFFLYLFYYLIS